METFILEDKTCWVEVVGQAAEGELLPAVYALMDGNFLESLPSLRKAITPMLKAVEYRPFLLVGFGPMDWNRDYSPWPAPAVQAGAEGFAGNGRETLSWMEERLLPEISARYPVSADENALLGYSLGGLFAVWALHESRAFSACGCCSASLWYDGWEEYAASHRPKAGCRVYMSLGKSEEKARDRRLASIGNATRSMAQRLEADPAVAEFYLHWNNGGHFKAVEYRTGQALTWLVKR